MRGRRIAAWTVPLVLCAGLGGYAWADASDLVPGILTTAPEGTLPAPFLSAATVTAAPGPTLPVDPLGTAPLPDAAAIQDLAQALRDDPRTGASTNVAVVDLATGAVLADLDGGSGQVPASTAKVLTVVAAIATLGRDYHFTTTATWDAQAQRVTLVAGGDMMLAADAGHGGARNDANGWAGLGDLARATASVLAAHGATAVTVAVDDSAYPEQKPPAWPAYVIQSGYGAPVSGLAVNVAKTQDALYASRWPDPSLNAAQTFTAQLVAAGVDATLVGHADATGEAVATVDSAPLWLVVEHLIHESDNTIAELVSRQLGLETGRDGTSAGGAAAVMEALAAVGLDTTGLELYDGAGYSTQNRVSPFHLVNAMRLTMTTPELEHFLEWLPVGAMEGTVADRFGGTPAAGLMRAKTGSLTGVTSLAGIVQTADGRVLAFAVLADGMPYGQDRPRTAIDEFITALANCGCGG